LKAQNEALQHQLSQDSKGELYSEIEALKERNRLLHIKSREERQKLEERLKSLEYSFECQGRRLAEKQARNQQLQADLDVPNQLKLPDAADLLNQLKAKRKKSRTELADVIEILEILEGDEPKELLE
jgi:hypothetical protein